MCVMYNHLSMNTVVLHKLVSSMYVRMIFLELCQFELEFLIFCIQSSSLFSLVLQCLLG